jgi:hypothetical protein
MKTQLISRQRNWQPEPTKNLVTRVPVKEGSKLGKARPTRQMNQIMSENMQMSPEKVPQKKSEYVNSWKDIEGLSWLFLDDMGDY